MTGEGRGRSAIGPREENPSGSEKSPSLRPSRGTAAVASRSTACSPRRRDAEFNLSPMEYIGPDTHLLVRLAVLGGPRELRGAEAEVKQPLALRVEEEEGLGVHLGQTHPMTRVDLEAAKAAHLRLEHHGRCYTGALARGRTDDGVLRFTHSSFIFERSKSTVVFLVNLELVRQV